MDELETLLPQWNDFLDRGTIGHHIQNDPRMIAMTLRQQTGLKPLIILIWENDRIACIAPFYYEEGRFQLEWSVWKIAPLRARILRIFGEAFIYDRDVDQKDAISTVFKILQARMPSMDYLCVLGLKQYDCLWRQGINQELLQSWLGCKPFIMRSEKHHEIHLPYTIDQYLVSLSPNTRQNLRRTTRRFFEDGQARIAKITQSSDIANLLDWADQIYRNSWQGRTFCNSPWKSASLRQMLEEVATKGWLQSYVLLRDERPVAFEHGYYYRDIFYGLDCAYDQDWSSAGPGSVLMFSVIQDLIAQDRARIVDFGLGDMAYKRTFGNVEVDASTVYFVPPGRWRILFALQSVLNRTYDAVRNNLIHLKIDKFIRKLVKRQK